MQRLLSKRQAFWLPVVVGLLVLIAFVSVQLHHTNGQLGAPLDDAWIHFQFARNLSNGDGFSYNPGEPTPGSTAPLWTILLTFPALLTDNLMLPGLLLSACSFLGTIYLTARLTYDLSGRVGLAMLAGLGVALTGRMVWAGWSGMEATAFAFASLLAVRHYKYCGMTAVTALLMGLASQLRPEAHALFALAGLSWFVSYFWQVENRNRVGIQLFAKQASIALGVYLLVALPYALFSLSVTGKPLANTFYAKSNTGFAFSIRTLRETLALHWWDNPVSFLLVPFGLVVLWRKSRLSALWLVGLPLFVSLIIAQTFHHGRYTLPLVPFQMVAAALGVGWLVKSVFRIPYSVFFNGLQITDYENRKSLIAIIFGFVLLLGGIVGLQRWATMLGTNSREIIEIDVALGNWLAANTPEDALIAVDDIGAIGYLSGRRVLDLNGLISPEMWPALEEPIGLTRNQIAMQLLSDFEPDYLAIFPNWHFEIATNPQIVMPIERFTTASRTMIADTEAIVYVAQWPYVASADSTTSRQAEPQHPINTTLGSQIELLGYDLTKTTATLDLILYWHSIAPAAIDYSVFIHLLDQNGNIVAQTDGQPLNFLTPTSLWRTGDIIRDPRTVELPADLAVGNYQLMVGMYDRESGVRLAVEGDLEHPELVEGVDSIPLQQLDLP